VHLAAIRPAVLSFQRLFLGVLSDVRGGIFKTVSAAGQKKFITAAIAAESGGMPEEGTVNSASELEGGEILLIVEEAAKAEAAGSSSSLSGSGV